MLERSNFVYRSFLLLSKRREFNYLLKRILDYLVAGILLLLFCPIFLVIVLLIAQDSPGSIFFRQARIGLNGEEFMVWKFRTMEQNAENLQQRLEAKNEVAGGVLFKIKSDPRITDDPIVVLKSI